MIPFSPCHSPRAGFWAYHVPFRHRITCVCSRSAATFSAEASSRRCRSNHDKTMVGPLSAVASNWQPIKLRDKLSLANLPWLTGSRLGIQSRAKWAFLLCLPQLANDDSSSEKGLHVEGFLAVRGAGQIVPS